MLYSNNKGLGIGIFIGLWNFLGFFFILFIYYLGEKFIVLYRQTFQSHWFFSYCIMKCRNRICNKYKTCSKFPNIAAIPQIFTFGSVWDAAVGNDVFSYLQRDLSYMLFVSVVWIFLLFKGRTFLTWCSTFSTIICMTILFQGILNWHKSACFRSWVKFLKTCWQYLHHFKM